MTNSGRNDIISRYEIEVWLSLVERYVRDVEVASSNLVTSTINGDSTESPFFFCFLAKPLEISLFCDNYIGLVLPRIGVEQARSLSLTTCLTTYKNASFFSFSAFISAFFFSIISARSFSHSSLALAYTLNFFLLPSGIFG